MKVCDYCKDLTKPVAECTVDFVKNESKKQRSMKKYPIDICEDCITKMIHKLGIFLRTINLDKRNE